jgi:hypothetical protein
MWTSAGVALLAVAITTHLLKRIKKLRGWLYLGAGVALIAGLGSIGANLLKAGARAGATLTIEWGIEASAILGIVSAVLAVLLIHSLLPRNGKPSGWHGPVFFFVPGVLVSASGFWSGILATLFDAARGVDTNVGG